MRSVKMSKGRMEAFSDGVIAIIITIMVLEIKEPQGHDLKALFGTYHFFVNYIISFVYVGIYWNNHHHMMQVVKSINGAVLWANLHFLFWLSLIPFVSAWMGESHFTDPWPIAFYGFILLMNGFSYNILVRILLRHEGENSLLAAALGNDQKGKISVVIYCIAIALTCINTYISFGLYILVACIWLIPDKRIEKKIIEEGNDL
jgi:uncharacterized membrane protein